MNYLGKSQFAADPYFNGAIDDFRIYTTGLSAPEIAPMAISPAAVIIPRGSYQSWTGGYSFPLGMDSPTADANRNGLANVFEWLFGTDPVVSGPASPAWPEMRTVTGSEFPGADPSKRYLGLTAIVRKETPGWTLVAQAADSPALLDGPGSSADIVSVLLQDLGDFEKREWIHTKPVDGDESAFMRLKLIGE